MTINQIVCDFRIWTTLAIIAGIYFLRPRSPPFPLLNTFPNDFRGRKARSALHQHAGKIISDGLARLNSPFCVKVPYGVKIILPHTLAGWVKANKDLDHKELVKKDFFAGFPGFEAQTVLHSADEALKTVIRSKMCQNASTIATMSLSIARGLDSLWGNADSWHTIDWYKDTTGVIARGSSSVFVGPEKCDDPEWLDLVQNYWFLPNPTTCRKLVTRARIIMNQVTAQRQEEALKAKLEGRECSQFNDALSWTQAAGVKGEAGDIQLSLAMAGLFTTSEAFRQILVEIATHPDIVPALRKEVTEQVTTHGATISALTNMVLLDSVMKEAQILSSPKVALERIALNDTTLPDGNIIPRGSHIMVESMNLWDPAVYPKPYEFDGYRFLRRREAGDTSSQFVQSSADYHVFGGGRHICPGRFFANNILKLALSHILLKYDIRLQDGCGADVLPMGFYTMVNPMRQHSSSFHIFLHETSTFLNIIHNTTSPTQNKNTMSSCTACGKSPPEVSLKKCAKCNVTPYCSRDCQKDDWKAHKKLCGKGPPPLDTHVSNPFTRLGDGTWLHDRPEKDVFTLLIDAYRLRVDDEYKFDGIASPDSLYSGGDPVIGFQRFLDSVEHKTGLLPSWWTAETREECLNIGKSGDAYANVHQKVDKAGINQHYGDDKFAMQLRMFAEAVYGRGPGGTNGTAMREMLAAAEVGEGPRHMSLLDASRLR
ncbi:cytochrome P450 [Rhypophila decipiens]|uniref:Cytochrome P450 n=1 Tax=Rhypophila decipiens TaxID=261697 RepID=A0AAN6XZ18_9PEZI|nr:cytochrome P450 [Rhypophila decipiens]